jgi:PAS domain S-box-containing protein
MTASALFWQELGGTLFEEAGDALFLFDPDSEQIRDANPMSQRLSGYTRRELLDSNITHLIRSEIDGGMQRMRLAFRRTGVFHSQEGFLLRHKDNGRWVPVNLTITRLHTESQTVGLLTARDITERRDAMARLRDSEQRHRMLLEQLPAIIWTTDTELRILSNTGTGLTGIGEKPGEQVGKTMAEALGSNDPNFLPMAAHLRALAGEKVTYEMEWKGRAWQTIIEPMRGPDGAIIGTVGLCLDCTERKLADEALRASEATYRTLINNLTQSIFLKDRDLKFIAVNPPFCRSFGKTADEVIGKDDFFISPPHLAEKYRADDRKVMQDRKRVEVEEQTLLQGKLHTVQTVKTPVLDDKGEAVGVLGIFWDVTDQRNLEAQLRQAHKMDAVGQLAGGIAHDFNNLLTGIIGNLALALADLPESNPSRDLLSSAETAAVRAAELTRQLLGFSRRTPLLSRPLNLNSVLEETLRLIQRTFDPRIEVRVACAPDLWAVQADAAQMGQVLMNLCLNARDAMPQGGVLTLRTANLDMNAATAAKSIEGRAGHFVHLQVADTGTGMSPEVCERIFEPFFTTKEQGKGTGLGLAMVFGILKQHQGWIDCQSEPGRGTTFNVYLPALTAAPVQSQAALPDGIRGGRETILLADDEEVVSRLGETILRRHGYRVLMAGDGVEAVEIYRRQPHTIDLVVLDLSMPRLSGPETLRELRQINPGVRVLISSGYSSDENLRAVEREGVLGFVAKPYRPAELARQVRAALDKQ